MRIDYSDHALERCLERNVSHAEVERVLKHGTETVQADGRFRKVAIVNDRRIRVVFEKLGPKPWTFRIVTVVLEGMIK